MHHKTSWQKYTGKVAWPTIILFISLLMGYIILGYLYLNGLSGLWTALIGSVLAYGMFTIGHEACHGNISGGVKSFQRVEQFMGWASSSFLMFPYSAFVVIHLRHHAYTNDPVKDPDNYVNGTNWLSIFLRCTTLIGHYFGLSFGQNSKKDPAMSAIRKQSLIFLIALLLVISTFILVGLGSMLFYVFVLSALIAAPVLAFSFDWIPHYPHQNLDKHHNTRVITIPGLEFVSLYQSYHLMHHLYPRVPFYHYKDCFKDYEKELLQEHAPIEGFRKGDLSLLKKQNTYNDIKDGKQWSYVLEVENVTKETHDTIKIVFKNLEKTVFTFESGQYLVVTDYLNEKAISRCYSICEDPLTGKLAIAIKRVPRGKLSNHLVDTVKAGSKLKVSGPFGNFVLPEIVNQPLLLIAGGSGITPIISILKTALRTSNQKVTLLYGCKGNEDVIFEDKLGDLLKLYPDKFHYLLSFEILDLNRQHKYLLDISQDTLCYVCGPSPMMEASRKALALVGIPVHQINFEEFSYAPERLSGNEHLISAEIHGKEFQFKADTSETILNASLRNDKELPYACGMGQCGTCKTQLISGEVDWETTPEIALLPNELEQGLILPCICKPKTAISIQS